MNYKINYKEQHSLTSYRVVLFYVHLYTIYELLNIQFSDLFK